MGKIKRLWFRIRLWHGIRNNTYVILVFNILFMIVITFVMVWGWFLFAPKTANLSYEGEVQAVEIEARVMENWFDIYSLYLDIDEGGTVAFSPSPIIEYNGETYDNVSQLCISDESTVNRIELSRAWTFRISFYAKEYMHFSLQKDVAFSPIALSGSEGLAFSLEDSSYVLKTNMAFVTAKDKNGTELFTTAKCEELLFKSTFTLNISKNSAVGFYPIDVKGGRIRPVFSNISIFSDIKSVKYFCTGEWNFSLGAQPTKYEIKEQKVTVSGAGLEAAVSLAHNEENGKIAKSNLKLNGMVNEATISGVSLFPDFWGWYRDNIYFAPLSLVTVVFGAVSMMKKTKKEK